MYTNIRGYLEQVEWRGVTHLHMNLSVLAGLRFVMPYFSGQWGGVRDAKSENVGCSVERGERIPSVKDLYLCLSLSLSIISLNILHYCLSSLIG